MLDGRWQDNETVKRVVRVSRMIVPYIIYLLVSFLSALILFYGYNSILYALMECFMSFFIFYSTARISTIGDHTLRDRFFEREEGPPREGAESIRFLLNDEATRVELPLLILILFLLPIDFGVMAIGRVLFSGVSFYLLRRLLITLISLPILLCAYFLGRCTAFSHWRSLPRYERWENRSFLQQFLAYLGFVSLYLLMSWLLPVTLSGWLGIFAMLLIFPVLGLLALVFWVATVGLRYLRVCRVRRRLMRRVSAACKKNGYTLEGPTSLYKNILSPDGEITFSVRVSDGEVYDCLVYSTLSRWRYLFFEEDGMVTSSGAPRRGIGGLFTPAYSVRSYYAFESENRKVVIVTPAVKKWFLRDSGTGSEFLGYGADIYNAKNSGAALPIGRAGSGWVFAPVNADMPRYQSGGTKEIFPGDTGWGYKFYNAETFCGLLERGALGLDYGRRD